MLRKRCSSIRATTARSGRSAKWEPLRTRESGYRSSRRGGGGQPGSRTDAMIRWIDLFLTLIDAAGGKVPAGLDGRSFLEVLRGPEDDAPGRHLHHAQRRRGDERLPDPGGAHRRVEIHPQPASRVRLPRTHIDNAAPRRTAVTTGSAGSRRPSPDPGVVQLGYHERPAEEPLRPARSTCSRAAQPRRRPGTRTAAPGNARTVGTPG